NYFKLVKTGDGIATLQVYFKANSKARLILHRTMRSCGTNAPIMDEYGREEQIFPVGENSNYWNFMCSSRYQEQCIDDGSYDVYYDESCERINPGRPTSTTLPTVTTNPTITLIPSVLLNITLKPTIFPKPTVVLNLTIIPSLKPHTLLHRILKNCGTDITIGIEQVFPVGEGTGYMNFKCTNRKTEQCSFLDPFDSYYDEWCEYPGSSGGGGGDSGAK
ncbi:MAG: hypothetical protein ABH863_05470, partial [Candidatus Micrarchaeota archaeon]